MADLHWKTFAGYQGVEEYYAGIAEKKAKNRIRKRFLDSLRTRRSEESGTTSKRRKTSKTREETIDIPELDEALEDRHESPNELSPTELSPTVSSPFESSTASTSRSDKKIQDLEIENARLKYRQDELKREVAKMSGSHEQLKSIRMLLVAKIKVADPLEDEEDLIKQSLGHLVTKYESAIVPLTASRDQKEAQKLAERVKKLEKKNANLKAKLEKESRNQNIEGFKTEILKAMRDQEGSNELQKLKKAEEDIESLKETVKDLKIKKRLQQEWRYATEKQESELKKILDLSEDEPLYVVVERVKDLKKTVSRYEDIEARNLTSIMENTT